MLLVQGKCGQQFTVTEFVGSRVIGMSITVYTYWVKDGRELTEPEMAELTIIREVDSTL